MANPKLKQQTEENLKNLKEDLKKKKEKSVDKTAKKDEIKEIEPSAISRPSSIESAHTLGFESSEMQSQSPLERNLAGEPSPISSPQPSQQKKEESYSEAKLLYENRESQRHIEIGREIMRADRIPTNVMPLRNETIPGVRQAQIINPLLDAGQNTDDEAYMNVKLVDTNKQQRMPWEIDEDRIKKYR